jgi:low affinity Fe/Cu permease
MSFEPIAPQAVRRSRRLLVARMRDTTSAAAQTLAPECFFEDPMSNSCDKPGLRSALFSFSRFARWTERQVGSPISFAIAVAIVVLWAGSGPFFGWSDTWQLVINTGTTIVTFLMVFLIQSTQSRDTQALHLKLDELIRVNRAARNSLLNLEEMSEEEIEQVKTTFRALLTEPQPRTVKEAA